MLEAALALYSQSSIREKQPPLKSSRNEHYPPMDLPACSPVDVIDASHPNSENTQIPKAEFFSRIPLGILTT
jgi:hypothetical protein